jgi:hypothetical protein
MRVLAYKLLTHSRFVGFVKFKDGNKYNHNKINLEKVDINYVINDIIDGKDNTNWDIVFGEDERKYIKNNSEKFARFFYNDF